jgi:hypothetical protein
MVGIKRGRRNADREYKEYREKMRIYRDGTEKVGIIIKEDRNTERR